MLFAGHFGNGVTILRGAAGEKIAHVSETGMVTWYVGRYSEEEENEVERFSLVMTEEFKKKLDKMLPVNQYTELASHLSCTEFFKICREKLSLQDGIERMKKQLIPTVAA